MYSCLHLKYLLFLSDFNESWIFWTDFTKNTLKSSWKSVQWGPSCSTRTDGQTYMTKLAATFRNFGKAPKETVLLLTSFRIQKICGQLWERWQAPLFFKTWRESAIVETLFRPLLQDLLYDKSHDSIPLSKSAVLLYKSQLQIPVQCSWHQAVNFRIFSHNIKVS